MALPQLKTGQIADLVNAEMDKSRSDEFSLKRIEREIASLLKSSDSSVRNEALSLSGALAALRFDMPTAHRYYEQALAASGYSAFVYYNYAVILLWLGFPGRALRAMEACVEKVPDDPAALRLAVLAAGAAFDVTKLEEYRHRLELLGLPDGDSDVRLAIENSQWQKSLLMVPGVTREALLERYERAHMVGFEQRLRVPKERATTTMRGTLLEWSVDCDDAEIAKLNFEVAMALSALEPNPCESLVSFGYTAVEAVTDALPANA